jgi:hypothetical protein
MRPKAPAVGDRRMGWRYVLSDAPGGDCTASPWGIDRPVEATRDASFRPPPRAPGFRQGVGRFLLDAYQRYLVVLAAAPFG